MINSELGIARPRLERGTALSYPLVSDDSESVLSLAWSLMLDWEIRSENVASSNGAWRADWDMVGRGSSKSKETCRASKASDSPGRPRGLSSGSKRRRVVDTPGHEMSSSWPRRQHGHWGVLASDPNPPAEKGGMPAARLCQRWGYV